MRRLGFYCLGIPPGHFNHNNKPTKKMKLKSLLAALCAVTASIAFADEKIVVKTTTTTGTIEEYAPGKTFIVKETSGPVTYHYGTKVEYVTKKGKVLTDDDVRTRIKVGSPVSVHYVTEGERRMIRRVEIDD